MAKKKKKKSTFIGKLRRVSQTFFLFALNPAFFASYGFCFPVMNCWACPAAAFGCPIGAMGQFFIRGLIPFFTIGLLVLAGALIGRMLCGWVCPFGFIQDLVHKIRIPGVKKKPHFPHVLRWAKYAFLIVTVIWIPLQWGIHRSESGSEPNDFFFCNICPAGTLEAAIPVRLLGTGEAQAIGGEEVADAGSESGDLFAETPDDGLDFLDEDSALAGEEFLADEGAAADEGDMFGEEEEGEGGLFDEGMNDGLGFLEGEEEEGGAGGEGGPPIGMGSVKTSNFEFYVLSPRMWILYGFFALFILWRRPFCRGMCPIGAVFSILNRFSFLRMRVKKDACKACNACAKTCPVNNQVFQSPGHQDCVKCLECIQTCKRGGVEAGLVGITKREDFLE